MSSFSFTSSTPVASPSRRTRCSTAPPVSPNTSIKITAAIISSPVNARSRDSRLSISSQISRSPSSSQSNSVRNSTEFYNECDRFIPSRLASNLEDAFSHIDSNDPNFKSENNIGSSINEAQQSSNQNMLCSLLRSELLGEPLVATKIDGSSTSHGVSNTSNGVLGSPSTPTRARKTNVLRFSTSPSNSASSGQRNHNSLVTANGGGLFNSSSSSNHMSYMNGSTGSGTTGNSSKKAVRKISRIPYKVLDAPALQDDYYLNLVDWSSSNMLSVALGSSVYLWSAYNSKVTKIV